ncbi:MAG: hypothetical protein KA366_06240 [Hydromonas sp.]|nr:hypothetical protein [Hydromonas sp.]
MSNLLWEIFQQMQVSDAQSQLSRLSSQMPDVHAIEELEEKLQALSVTVQAMWDLVSEKLDLEQYELENKIEELSD